MAQHGHGSATDSIVNVQTTVCSILIQNFSSHAVALHSTWWVPRRCGSLTIMSMRVPSMSMIQERLEIQRTDSSGGA